MMTKTIKWTRSDGGGSYTSADGRFSIINCKHGVKRPSWVLFDRSRQDECIPEYGWSRHCSTLASAKDKAERVLLGRRV
jgi:hypothetical protein